LKTSDFKDIAELVGIASSVLGLVFVTYRLRQNNKQLAEQSRQSGADGIRQITLSVATSPDLARLISRDVSLEEMTGTEEMQLIAWFVAWPKSAETAFLQHQAGILDEIWLARRIRAIEMLESQKSASLYEWYKQLFVPKCVSHIDEALNDRQAR